jgi:hypothetical protein
LVDVTKFEQYQEPRKLLALKGITIAGVADTAFLFSLCQQRKPSSVLETGVAHGMSSLAILPAMDAAGSGHLTSIDMPYRGSADDSYVGQAVPESLRSRWGLLKPSEFQELHITSGLIFARVQASICFDRLRSSQQCSSGI